MIIALLRLAISICRRFGPRTLLEDSFFEELTHAGVAGATLHLCEYSIHMYYVAYKHYCYTYAETFKTRYTAHDYEKHSDSTSISKRSFCYKMLSTIYWLNRVLRVMEDPTTGVYREPSCLRGYRAQTITGVTHI
ncbi:hypothetical protein BBBOND_0405870 [Babesia bigemina]|uniref:Uncharacterized protein n=1 Tax=Babesia bigemina TaxID=5866 RepID=A0A061DBZ3_BABBI|nr:hypothetical protein BBBOND_0405870 [Babesia bigemina]CDR98103.1 hypothetical protein BBBOND_0405870 [Babesia bigemina]|eukprot:XP_012770289.1 hypothetical protein BBBOND_0405870 [Babesia bigemina]